MELEVNRDDMRSRELRFEFAWRWFSLHANQRISLVGFFVISAGILANAYVTLIHDGFNLQASFLGLAAAVVSMGFVLLDRRNRQLVRIGEHLLAEQQAELTTTGQAREWIVRELIGTGKQTPFKHWLVIEGIEALVGVSFLGGAIWAAVQ